MFRLLHEFPGLADYPWFTHANKTAFLFQTSDSISFLAVDSLQNTQLQAAGLLRDINGASLWN